MTDFHHNVFFYYRGSTKQHGQAQEQQQDQQLEDNTTKALINTLEHCEMNVRTDFLQSLGIKVVNPSTIKFELQKPTIREHEIPNLTQKLLLAIVGKYRPEYKNISEGLNGLPKGEGDSRPDAWIYGEGFVVLLESKVEDSRLEHDQMRCHWEKMKAESQPHAQCIVRTWGEVHQFFAKLLPKLQGKDEFVVQQFTQYLEWTEKTRFAGFKEDDFEFFGNEEKDPDEKRKIRNAMEALAERVLEGDRGLKAFDASYAEHHVGNFGKSDDHFWVAFGPRGFRQEAHQTIALFAGGLDVFVNIELMPAINKLRKKIKGNESVFRKVISELPAPFTLQIQERRKKRPRFFDYDKVEDFEGGVHDKAPYDLKDVHSPGFDRVCALISQIQYPSVSVRRRIHRKEVLSLSKEGGEALGNEILGLTKAFHSLVQFVNK